LKGEKRPDRVLQALPTTPGLRADAPLLEAYLAFREAAATSFTVPGHKGRSSMLDAGLAAAVAGDVPLYGGVDTVKLTGGYLAQAERLAACWYGADWCRFSTGGSTHANQSMCLSLGRPGDKVVVTRSLHRSVLLGLVLADLEPCWLPPSLDPRTHLPLGVAVADVEHALEQHPEAVAVMLTEPSYLGTLSDLEAIVEVAHRFGVPVVVDQAWGAHFGAHPGVPRHALARGADAMVTSVHKMLVGYSQASLVCARTERFDVGRLERGFEATHTTSPAGSVLASIDASRALLASRGEELLDGLLALVRGARERLRSEVSGLEVPDEHDFRPGGFDPTRLVLLLSGVGADGIALERRLVERGLPVELADRDTLVPVVSIADDSETVEALVCALVEVIRQGSGPPRELPVPMSWGIQPVSVVSPRQAYFAAHESVPADDAVGRISAELIAPYPPGIPVLAPGELVTAELLAGLRSVAATGVRIAYASDPSLTTLEVLTR
jgi:arginine decarboxylase